MDINMEDPLESVEVEFETSIDMSEEAGTSQGNNSVNDIMDFESSEHPLMMDVQNQEVVVSDHNDYILSNEESVFQSDNSNGNLSINLNESGVELNLHPQSILLPSPRSKVAVASTSEIKRKPQYITIKPSSFKAISTMPRQVPIAPKPFITVPKSQSQTIKVGNKHFTIAPKLSTSAMSSTGKKISLSSVVQGQKQIIAQIGKQLVVMPASATQKVKLQTSSGKSIQAQIVSNKGVWKASKPAMAKVVLQGQQSDISNQPAVLTKIAPSRVVVQQKTVPISNNQMIVTSSSPAKQSMLNSQKSLLLPQQPSPQKYTIKQATKQVIIAPNKQSIIVNNNNAQVVEESTSQDAQQKTQLHEINVPGKGVQYIKVVTSASSAPKSFVINTVNKKDRVVVNSAPKAFVFTDKQGNIIQVTDTKKIMHPPSTILVPPPNANVPQISNSGKVGIPQQKFAKIAPSKKVIPKKVKSPNSLLVHTPIQEIVKEEPIETSYEVSYEIPDSNVTETDLDNTVTSNEEPAIRIAPNALYNHQDYLKTIKVERDGEPIDFEAYLAANNVRTESPTDTMDYREKGLTLRSRKACNCTKSQCLKLYCDCFASGEFCNNCNCINCHNNLPNEELRQKAIRGCLDRNPYAFKPKIGKTGGEVNQRKHKKGCHCKRSGCLKNYCECYEAKIACSDMCKCIGCRNLEDNVDRTRRKEEPIDLGVFNIYRNKTDSFVKQPCSFLTSQVIDAVCQCLIAAATDDRSNDEVDLSDLNDPVQNIIEEFSRCLQDIISASYQNTHQEQNAT